mgnify:CR=1 FL=1
MDNSVYIVACQDYTEIEAKLTRLMELMANGYVWEATAPSLERIGLGLLWAVVLGVPVGVGIGLYARLREITHVPFQFLRMISPLAWMPIAVLAFSTWDGAIVFLITVAAVWPVLFSTAQGVRRIDPLWFKVAKNLGADGWQMLRRIILPAIGQDIFAGIRLLRIGESFLPSVFDLHTEFAAPLGGKLLQSADHDDAFFHFDHFQHQTGQHDATPAEPDREPQTSRIAFD